MGEQQRHCKDAFDGVQDDDVDFIMAAVAEAQAVRPGLLPHQHAEGDILQRFPTMPILDDNEAPELNDYDGSLGRGAVEHAGDVIAREIVSRAQREGRKRIVS